nr:amidase family protein [Gammaproteobacteria bacterium]
MSPLSELLTRTITDVAPLIAKREVSPVELFEAQLERIAAHDASLHSYLLLTAELGRAQALAAEREIAAGDYRGPLHGIP